MPRVAKAILCLHCMQKPAKILNLGEEEGPIFCTMHCAAVHGVSKAEDEVEWCGKHRVWFIAVDGCHEDHPEDEEEEEEDDDE